MTSDCRIEFKKLLPPPFPWRACAPDGQLPLLVGKSLTLRRILHAGRSLKGRAAVRAALAEELQRTAGRPVQWRETEKGPVLLEPIAGKNTCVSISYTPTEAWLALGWEGPLGVDVAVAQEIPDWEELASTYLGADARERLHRSNRRAADFAREWCAFEARLKLGGLSLDEGALPPPAMLYTATFGALAVAVAVEPCPQ